MDAPPKMERRLTECPKCGARGICEKHGMTASGIDLRARGENNCNRRLTGATDGLQGGIATE